MIDVLLVADDLVGAPKAKVMLTERQQQALDFISNAKDPVSGKEIARHFGVDPGTVFAHYIPALKKHFGVKNRKGRGYYLPKE